MSDKNTLTDSLKEIVKDAGQQIKGRLSNLYFSYILTSLIAFNWQNILMLFMSNSSIEKILGDWNGDPEFAHDYFWIPVVVGYLASVILPLLSIPIAFLLSVISLIIKKIDDWATNVTDSILIGFGRVVDAWRAKRIEASNHYKQLKNEIIHNERRINGLKAERERLEDLFVEISKVYEEIPGGAWTPENFQILFERVKEKGLLDRYRGNSSVWIMMNNIYFLHENKNTSSDSHNDTSLT
ncbi:Uncharacterised protein [Enterobacter cloacae]|nr:Uncharacterised protein [Enterobacter cloacae]VAM08228.1 Uncharacterised protein [Enterobacter kobei]